MVNEMNIEKLKNQIPNFQNKSMARFIIAIIIGSLITILLSISTDMAMVKMGVLGWQVSSSCLLVYQEDIHIGV